MAIRTISRVSPGDAVLPAFPAMLRKGSVFAIGGVIGNGIILRAADGEDYLIDSETFAADLETAET